LTINLKEVISSNSATYVKDYIEGDFNLKEVISSNSHYIFHFSVWKIGVILFHFDLLLTFSFVISFSPIQLYFKLIIVFWILYRYAVLRRLNDDCLVAWKSGCGRHKLLRSVFLQAYHDFIVIRMPFLLCLQFYEDLMCIFCGMLFCDFVVMGDWLKLCLYIKGIEDFVLIPILIFTCK
jgi:hypothetical protein